MWPVLRLQFKHSSAYRRRCQDLHFTGTVTIPTPFTLGAVSVTATGTELNYVAGVTSAIQTQLGTKAPLASPIFTGVVSCANGLVGTPALNFGDSGSGFYRTFLNHIGMTLNGTQIMDWQPNDINFVSRLDGPDGSASNCPFTFQSGTQNTGMYKAGTNSLGLATGGTAAIIISSAQVVQFATSGTGSTTALLATVNCPATTGTSRHMYGFKFAAPDGSTVYVPGWK